MRVVQPAVRGVGVPAGGRPALPERADVVLRKNTLVEFEIIEMVRNFSLVPQPQQGMKTRILIGLEYFLRRETLPVSSCSPMPQIRDRIRVHIAGPVALTEISFGVG